MAIRLSKVRTWLSLNFLAVVVGGLSTAMGLVILSGLYFEGNVLLEWVSRIVPPFYNLGLGFLLCGTALLLIAGGWPRLAVAFVGIASVVNFLTLIEHFFGLNLGIDRLLMEQYFSVESFHPGSLARTVALCFALTGGSLLILRRSDWVREHSGIWKALVFFILTLGSAAFFGYLHLISSTYDWNNLVRMALYTAAGFGLLGIGFIALLGKEEKIKEAPVSKWVALPIAVGVVVTTVSLWQALIVQEQEQWESAVEAEGVALRRMISNQLLSDVQALALLAAQWQTGDIPSDKSWTSEAAPYLQNFPDFAALGWADVSGKQMRWAFAEGEGPSAELDQISGNWSELGMAALRAPQRGPPIAHPVTWTRRGSLLLAYKAIFHRAELNGFILGVIPISQFLDALFPGDVFPGYSMAVFEAGQEIYSHGDTAHEHGNEWGQQGKISFGEENWIVRIWPTSPSLTQAHSPLPDIALLVGLLMAWLFLWTFYLVRVVQAHVREVRAAQQALELEVQERRNAEEALMGVQKQLEALVENMPEGVILIDSDDCILLANPTARNYLSRLGGAAPGECLTALAGHPLHAVLQHSVGMGWHEIHVGEGNEVQKFEIAARKMDLPHHSSGHILVLRDVTQERKVQEHLKLQERLASVGQLAAGIAHDFNNVLQVILGYADLLKNAPEMTDQARKYLTRIREQGLRAAQTNRQILDFSRQSPSEKAPLEIVAFLKDFIKLLRNTIPENIELLPDFQPGDYWSLANVAQFQQALMNLVFNARDAMPDGGRLTFRCSRLDLRPGERPPYSKMPPGLWNHFSVSDTGTGIPPEILPRIFEPFFTTKDRSRGTGLGLAQVYGIVKQHNGFIVAQSEVGKGSTFDIYLPAVAEEKKSGPPQPMEQSTPGKGEAILVVEDEPMVLHVAREMLELLGYRVMTATNGRHGLEVFDQHPEEVTLVFTDVMMPEMDGMALFHELRSRNPHLPVVMMTGYPKKEGIKEFLSLSTTHWVQKPIDLAQLAAIIERALHEGKKDPVSIESPKT